MNKEIDTNIEKVEPQKYDMKKIFAIFFMLLLLYSASTKFVTITVDNEIWLDKYMYEVLGVQATIISAVIYLYSIFSQKKKITYVALILLVLSFIYSAYTYFRVETVVSGMGEAVETFIKNNTQYGDGVLFYLISFILLIIDVFIPEKNNLLKIDNVIREKIEDTQAIDQYILANFIYGLEKRPDLYNKLSVIFIKNDDEHLNININIESEQQEIIVIPKKDIKNISYKMSIISKETLKTENYDQTKFIRDIALFGGAGASIISSIRGDKIKDYYKIENTQIYDINITYNIDGQEKKLMFQTREKPADFINNLKLDKNLPDISQ